jgi:hypothetical protein
VRILFYFFHFSVNATTDRAGAVSQSFVKETETAIRNALSVGWTATNQSCWFILANDVTARAKATGKPVSTLIDDLVREGPPKWMLENNYFSPSAEQYQRILQDSLGAITTTNRVAMRAMKMIRLKVTELMGRVTQDIVKSIDDTIDLISALENTLDETTNASAQYFASRVSNMDDIDHV